MQQVDGDGSYAMIYLPQNKPFKIILAKISGKKKNVWWYDVRNGKATKNPSVSGNGAKTFTPPKDGIDWVLVIDDAAKNFAPPGTALP